uniref:Putative mitochondrial morphoproteinsis regulator n=1 Tax=Xenopsylla cheopis TaxID=163159 RepID=A0A6M2DNT1_XENCH
MTGDDNFQGHQSSIVVIREVYESENAYEVFEVELERALDAGYHTIIIEPTRLGDETGRWISVGNCLHKTAVLSGLGAIGFGILCPNRPLIITPLAVVSWFCTALYTVSWQFDPCCYYQVEKNPGKLSKIPVLSTLQSNNPTILVRKNIKRRIILHSTVTSIAAVFCFWRIYDAFK